MKVKQNMQEGKIDIYTKTERKILSDVRDYKKKNKGYSFASELNLNELKRIGEFLKFGKLLHAYFRLLLEIIISYSDSVCYILMIVSMMKNAGLISLFYPMVVFGYALMEETNTRKKFWYMMMIYTEILILTKFIY